MKRLLIYGLIMIGVIAQTGCKLDYVNPNGPTDTEITTTKEGMFTLSIGIKQYYGATAMESVIITPGTTAREIKGITTFTNVLEMEAGGTALPTFNGNILNHWTRFEKTIGMAETLISNAANVFGADVASASGVIAHAELFKAMAIGALATCFEQFPIETNKAGTAVFVPRAQGLQTAIQLLDDAALRINTTAPSAEFNTRILGSDFKLLDCINTFRARYNMMLGKYAESLAAANLVNLTSKSQFLYSTQSPNPVYNAIIVRIDYKPRENFGLPASLVEAGDGRLAFYLGTPNIVVGGETLKTVKGFFDDISKPIPVYLPDEVRLLKAEAIVRSGGNLASALTEINAVRTQATGDPFGVNANLPSYSGPVTVADLLTEIYRQRCAELFMTGLRLEDSRRFGRPAPPANVNPVPLSFERNRNFYPYPDQERLTNSNTPNDPPI